MSNTVRPMAKMASMHSASALLTSPRPAAARRDSVQPKTLTSECSSSGSARASTIGFMDAGTFPCGEYRFSSTTWKDMQGRLSPT